MADPFAILSEMTEKVNPAIILAEELMRKGIGQELDTDDFERAEKTLAVSKREIERVDRQFKALTKTPPFPGSKVPRGF